MEDSSEADSCPICFTAWQDTIQNYPRVLDCGHSLCLTCIAQFATLRKQEASYDEPNILEQSFLQRSAVENIFEIKSNAQEDLCVKCPTCREETVAASLNSLRKNFALIELQKEFQRLKRTFEPEEIVFSSSAVHCEEINESEESKEPTRIKENGQDVEMAMAQEVQAMRALHQVPTVRQYKYILSGELAFNEAIYDAFSVEAVDCEQIKVQLDLLNEKRLTKLPDLSQIKGPGSNPSNARIGLDDESYPKVDAGSGQRFGYFEYTADDEEGEGVSYEGTWMNGKRNGKGFMKSEKQADMWSYAGEFKDGDLDGFGIYSWKQSGDTFLGHFSKSVKDGFGVYQWSDSSRTSQDGQNPLYRGFWKANKMNGLGEYVYADGSVYVGNYHNGRPDGLGRLIWPDGNSYHGEWQNGMRSGTGRFKWVNGASYTGNFKENVFHGNGAFVYKDGSYYKGDFSQNKRHGFGKFQWTDGSYFVGFWKDGEKNGLGRHVSAEGNAYQASWKQGKQVKEGVPNIVSEQPVVEESEPVSSPMLLTDLASSQQVAGFKDFKEFERLEERFKAAELVQQINDKHVGQILREKSQQQHVPLVDPSMRQNGNGQRDLCSALMKHRRHQRASEESKKEETMPHQQTTQQVQDFSLDKDQNSKQSVGSLQDVLDVANQQRAHNAQLLAKIAKRAEKKSLEQQQQRSAAAREEKPTNPQLLEYQRFKEQFRK